MNANQFLQTINNILIIMANTTFLTWASLNWF